MSGNSRRRPDRPNSASARRRLAVGLEPLEGRQLLSRLGRAGGYNHYAFTDPPLIAERTVEHTSPNLRFDHPYGNSAFALSRLDNDGKILTGKDREGDEWQITVHGPGVAIVTDATPNDGSLDDDLDTIQLVGTDPHRTYVTGQTIASARVVTDGVVLFNRLIAANGVRSIILNGFTLAQTVPPAVGEARNAGPEIFLPGGVGFLSFHDILGTIDANPNAPDEGIEIVIGNPNSPLRVRPTIKIDSIFNTVFDSSLAANPNGTPPTIPTVSFLVNGEVHGFEILSATNSTVEALRRQSNPPYTAPTFSNDIPNLETVLRLAEASERFNFPDVGTNGRTALRATGVGRLRVNGRARNFTASRGATPFASNSSGLNRLGRASFGGNADGVGLDVRGRLGGLRAVRGLGNPTGLVVSPRDFGVPDFERGYPSFGLQGAVIAADEIGHLTVAPSRLILQSGQDPDFMQLNRQGSTSFLSRPGEALTSAVIASAGSIGAANIVGNSLSSEIKAGFDYTSAVAGLEGTRGRSHIRRFRQRGDLIDSVVSASYRATNGVYGDRSTDTDETDDVAGPGTIQGRLQGSLFTVGAQTALNQRGVGFFARRKIGYLPPPEGPKRVQSVLVR